MNDASKVPAGDIYEAQAGPGAELDPGSRLGLYFAVGLAAGSVIALQIDIMRVFAVGSWAHFGSLVVSLAMLGFGLASAVMTSPRTGSPAIGAGRGDRFARPVWARSPSRANLYVQHLGFNAIFLVSDPTQKWKLLAIFLAELTPFLAGALVPWMRLPQEQPHFRPGLFRRSRRLGPLRARLPRGDVSVYARPT